MKTYRVLIHLDEGHTARAELALHNVQNLLDDLGEAETEVELVTNGPGIKALLKENNPHLELIKQLAGRGVRLVVCGNSLRAQGFEPLAFVEGAVVAPSGVGELVKRQAEGWAYIRP